MPRWTERRDVFPQGVASGDPTPDGAIVWTRRPPFEGIEAGELIVELATDETFAKPVARYRTCLEAASDWTVRVRVDSLLPDSIYWYRFIDAFGYGSRVGRLRTSPTPESPRLIRFAVVCCHNIPLGAQNGYRRMLGDELEGRRDELDFVLHLGDFIYEVVARPEDHPAGIYDRILRDVVQFPHGERIGDVHVPVTVDDYRALYKAYLEDPDLQDARARWPFVCVWDNHEFSVHGWQAFQMFGENRPAASRKVAANQAWFEYQPARVRLADDSPATTFTAPDVEDLPVDEFDDDGFGTEQNNAVACGSLKIYRKFRYGKNMELFLTDNRSFRSECLLAGPAGRAFRSSRFPWAVPSSVVDIIDAGRSYAVGQPPAFIEIGDQSIPNPAQFRPAQSMLGSDQKRWLLSSLKQSDAPWKVWGNSVATLDWRCDFHNLPAELSAGWPAASYASFCIGDWSGYRSERKELLSFLEREAIPGLVSLAGDRHAFFAGELSRELPPAPFLPVGVEFVTCAMSACGFGESAVHDIAPNHPLSSLYVHQAGDARDPAALNISARYGVSASMAWTASDSVTSILDHANAEVAPHLSFVDLAAFGYSLVTVEESEVTVTFVCLSLPRERILEPPGGIPAYEVTHGVKAWAANDRPRITRISSRGELPFAM